MSDKPNLRLIKNSTAQQNNFWRCCVLKREYFPEDVCEAGIPDLNDKTNKLREEPKCPWWINSKEHHYCFWTYVKDKSDKDGIMKELVQSELANLFGWSNTKTHFLLKQAIEELSEALKKNSFQELLESIDSDDLFDVVNEANFSQNSDDSSEWD